jgi:hypothetical protein
MCGISSRHCEAFGTRGVEANPIFQENGQACQGASHYMCIFGPSLISKCVQLRNFVYSLTSFRYGIISDQERAT